MRTLLSRATQIDPSFNVGLRFVVIIAVAEIFAALAVSRPALAPGRVVAAKKVPGKVGAAVEILVAP